MADSKEHPAIEIHEKSGKVFRIYQDGTVEGFEDDATVINRLPVRFVDRTAKTPAKSKAAKKLAGA